MFNPRLLVYFVLAVTLLAFSIYWRGREQKPNLPFIAKQIEKNIEQETSELNAGAARIIQAIRDSTDWPASKHIFILYDSAKALQWSTNQMVPDTRGVHSDTLRLMSNGGSYFLVKSFPVRNHDVHLNGYILMQERYPIQNQYLSSHLNTEIFPYDNLSIQTDGQGELISFSGVGLFQISAGPSIRTYPKEWLGWLSLLCGIVLLSLSTWMLVQILKQRKLFWLAATIVFLVLLSIRLVMVYGEYPGNIKTVVIFDSDQFASSSFSNSMANFFLNTIAFLLVACSAYWLIGKSQLKWWGHKSKAVQFIGVVFFLLLAFGSHLLPFLYIETIFGNSPTNLDVAQQLYFDPVRALAFGCVVLSSATGYFLFLTFFKSATAVAKKQAILFLTALTLSAIASLVGYHLNTGRTYEIPVAIAAIHLLLLYFGFTSAKLRFHSGRKFSIALVALVLLSVQASLTIKKFSIKRQQRAMVRYGNSFLAERDVLGEYLLSQAAANIESDELIRQQFTNPFNRLASISQKIKRGLLSNYLDRYEIQVSLLNNRGKVIEGDLKMPLDSIQKVFSSLDDSRIFVPKKITVQNLNQYFVIVPIKAAVLGYVALKLSMRGVTPTTVFPRLLLDDRFRDYASNTRFSHAVYQHGMLENSAGAFKYSLYSFEKRLSDPQLFNGGLSANGFYHVGIEDWIGRVAVVSIVEYSWFNLVANFSFLFLLGLSIWYAFFLMVNWKKFHFKSITYSNRIQLYIYGAMILPIMIIAGITLRLNSQSEQEHTEAENIDKANRLAQNLVTVFQQNPESLPDELLTQAKAVGVDLSVFMPTGTLLSTSQPDIYSSLLVSRLIQPEALKRIQSGNFLFSLTEQVGKLRFQNTYAAMRSPTTGEVVAILSVPFFESQQEGEVNQLRLASNIWTVFALVFLIFYLLSFVALDWLTKPLQVIASSLRRTTLSGTNRKLSWSSRDEIGVMIDEYNKLIDNLEVSKAELARKQREAAWREMARQVAHEIKNPLTPIKLTLQQMEMGMLKDKSANERNVQSIKTVLHQVEILNEIASSFSAFAQMPELKLERINVKSLINETIALYHNAAPHTVDIKGSDEPIWVMADPKLFVRIFGNIVLNAFQSGNGSPVTVLVSAAVVEKQVRIAFSDNGEGIPQDILDRIFIPYFSTKETGSGLGLAMAKQGIEQAGGKIWCASEVGKGSTFFIELPVVHVA